MKKVIVLLFIITIFVFDIRVYAASSSLSVSSGSVYVGGSFTATVNVRSAAAWNIHVSATGPVSGCSINQADVTLDATDTNKTFSVSCKATGAGTITVLLSGDVTSASDGNAISVSGSKTVNAIVDSRSKNVNLKELSVEGYNLVKIDNNNYTLSVSKDVTSINVKALAEDSKSKVTGTGVHNINIGDNIVEIIVTAENGAQNKIYIKVSRKEGYFIEDLEKLLSENQNDVIITLLDNTVITSKHLEKIKTSGKTITFNYYDNDKKIIYSYIVDGTKLDNINDIATKITNESNYKNEIQTIFNFADGINMTLSETNNMPSGIKIIMYVGNKYTNDEIVNLYAYIKDKNKVELVKEKLVVKNGYIEFDAKNYKDYFITKAFAPSKNSSTSSIIVSGKETNIFIITTIVEGILLLLIIILDILKVNPLLKIKKDKEEENNNINNTNFDISNNVNDNINNTNFDSSDNINNNNIQNGIINNNSNNNSVNTYVNNDQNTNIQ